MPKNNRRDVDNPFARAPKVTRQTEERDITNPADFMDTLIYGDSTTVQTEIVEVIPEGAMVPDQQGWRLGDWQLSHVGIVAPEQFTREDWEYVFGQINRMSEAVQWWVGDMLVIGEHKYGVTYDEFSRITGYEPKTLRNLKYVAQNVPIFNRFLNVSYTHHATVAPLPHEQQMQLLQWVAETGASVAALKAELKPDDGQNKLNTFDKAYKVIAKQVLGFKKKGTPNQRKTLAAQLRQMADDLESEV